MPERKHPRLSRLRTRIAAVVVGLMAVSLAAVASPAQAAEPVAASAQTSAVSSVSPVKAADLSKFRAGDIISDEVFFDWDTMTASQIQTFLNGKVSKCMPELGGKGENIVCLKDKKDGTQNRPADSYCKGYTGKSSETAAQIIANVAKSCGVNPQVILVMLQKEQALVTHTWPSEWRYTKALGQGCPDDAPCDESFAGFFNQVYGGARQMKVYAKSSYFSWYPVGQTSQVLYNPNFSCGSDPVTIKNTVTAGMYYYTPYQPNKAALAAGYGVGDSCSAYGNRNFYNYFTDWFGSTHKSGSDSPKPKPPVTVNVERLAGDTREETAAAVSQEMFPNGADKVIIVSGRGFPDALSASAAAARLGIPLLLARADSLPAATSAELQRLRPKSAVIVGGSSVIRSAVVKQINLSVPGLKSSRAAGKTRYATSIAVAKLNGSSSNALIATGEDFPDALTAAAMAYGKDAPVILVKGSAKTVGGKTLAGLKELGVKSVILFGGTSAISPGVSSSLLKNGIKPVRFGGATRYDTNKIAMDKMYPGAKTYSVLATGEDFPDALTATSLVPSSNRPVLLTKSACLSGSAASFITDRRVSRVTLVGGPSALSSNVAKLKSC